MLYGITGSHGSGKTTLAKALADSLGVDFMPSDITGIAKSLGYDPVAPMTLNERIVMQQRILEAFTKKLDDLAGTATVIDRTPIDMMAYTLAEVGMYSHMFLTPEEKEQLNDYSLACLRLARTKFYAFILTNPLPIYEEDMKRPAFNPSYQHHLHFLIRGILTQTYEDELILDLREIDLERRVEKTSEFITLSLTGIREMRESALHLH